MLPRLPKLAQRCSCPSTEELSDKQKRAPQQGIADMLAFARGETPAYI
jgi:hypothetical protein